MDAPNPTETHQMVEVDSDEFTDIDGESDYGSGT